MSGRLTPGVAVTIRRPSISTSVRAVPRPRRSSALMPAVPMKRPEFAWLNVARNCGSWLRMSPTLIWPRAVSSAPVSEVIGALDVRPGRLMRVPVTTTDGSAVPAMSSG